MQVYTTRTLLFLPNGLAMGSGGLNFVTIY